MKDHFLFTLYHQHCKLCYELLLCSKILYWSARLCQENYIEITLILGLLTQKRFNIQRRIPSNPASATVPSAHWFLQKYGFWENKSMNLFATRYPGNTRFSFLTKLFFTHQWQDLLCIFMHFTNKLLWHSNYSTRPFFSPIYCDPFVHNEERAICSRTRSTASCLNACFTTYRRRQGPLFYSVPSPDSVASRCYWIHSSNLKTALMYRKQIIALLECYSD